MKKIFFLLAIITTLLSYSQNKYAPTAKGELVQYVHYSLDYNDEHEQANWVYYRLTYDLINGNAKRKDNFRSDNSISTRSAHPNDYKNSGYDKGHLCPAADMKISQNAMDETFYMSNMSPQFPSLNRGKWSLLEDKIRSFVKDETDTLYVVTGPIFINNKGQIGSQNSITIPGFYYKVVYCPKRGGLAYILPNNKINEILESWLVSIDLVEALTGIDFFSQLDDEIENRIEAQVGSWDRPTIVAQKKSKNIELKKDSHISENNIEENNETTDCEKIKNDYKKIIIVRNILLVICIILLTVVIFCLAKRKESN
ncbi:DNA/RNA non-specific endonuclease [Bacteroidales bacterium OttesenSCG-928-I21]|nr:DNA/RNA non-specific endonuclease [Bacteroidales bacterium OttesenSCG-928-I21]